jgi:hypothetical protein
MTETISLGRCGKQPLLTFVFYEGIMLCHAETMLFHDEMMVFYDEMILFYDEIMVIHDKIMVFCQGLCFVIRGLFCCIVCLFRLLSGVVRCLFFFTFRRGPVSDPRPSPPKVTRKMAGSLLRQRRAHMSTHELMCALMCSCAQSTRANVLMHRTMPDGKQRETKA